MLLSLFAPAFAGAGPWTLPEGDVSIYGGAAYERITRLASSTGSWSEDVTDVDEGLEKATAQLIVAYGLRDRVEVEISAPYTIVTANRTDGGLCTALGLEACETTRGFGVFVARGKGLLLDELVGAPVSAGAGVELRLGQHTNETRARVTNLGEGTTDLGAFVNLGRSGGLGQGYWSGYLEVTGRYRFPNTDTKGTPVPGSELSADVEWLGGLHPSWAIGPSVNLLWRPEGVDIETLDAADPDRFGALRVFNLRAGGKLIVRSSARTSLAFAVFGTPYAVNNPADQIIVTAGLSGQIGPKPE